MDSKFIRAFVISGLILSLAACSPGRPTATAELETTASVPASSPVPASETSLPTPSSLPAASDAPVEFDCDSAREITIWDCRALVALFESTHGASWKEHSGWLELDTPCYWYGVTCEAGHVTELVLFDNGLRGALPPQLQDLTHLRVMRMMNNALSGNLAPWLGSFPELMELDLARNQLSGGIPAELGRLTNLRWLNLSDNELSGAIPAELGVMEQLNYLILASNRLSGSIPGQLGKLKNMSTLDLSHNQLSGSIPAELVHLPDSSWLDFSYNELSGAVPDEWVTESINEALTRDSFSAPRLWGNRLEGTIPASNEPTTEVLFEGIRFSFPSDVVESVWPEIVAGVHPTPGGAEWEGDPTHYSLTFASLSGPAAFQRTWGTWLQLPPQVRVYPVDGLESNEFLRARIEGLHELLEVKPDSPTDEIPVLPWINAAQVFRAQVHYLDFQNGSGVRFLTQYRQDRGPVTNDEIFYTFQGLTEDGAYYVVASFPLSTAVLPDTIDMESQAFKEFEQKNYGEYLREQVSTLDALPSDAFEPDLAMLDRIVTSLEVQPQ